MFLTKKFSKYALIVALVALNFSAPPESKAKAPLTRQPLISAASNRAKIIDMVGATGFAATGHLNETRVKGTCFTKVQPTGLAHDFGMVSGDLLLTINNKVADSPEATQSLIAEFSGVNTTVRFARKEGNALVVHESPQYWVIPVTNGPMISSPGSDDVTSYGTVTHAPRQTVTAEELEDLMTQMVNNARSMNGGLPRLKKSKLLSDMARAYAEDMAKRDFFGHKNPEGLGMVQRGTALGITNHLAENLGMNRGSLELREHVKRCQENMMNEPPNVPGNHRSNILDPESKSIGVGVAFPARGGVITVQEFSHDDIP